MELNWDQGLKLKYIRIFVKELCIKKTKLSDKKKKRYLLILVWKEKNYKELKMLHTILVQEK